MKNKHIANILVASVLVATVYSSIEESSGVTSTTNTMLALSGLGMIISGIWVVIRMYQTGDYQPGSKKLDQD